MSHKMQLSGQRENTVINTISQRQESALMRAVHRVWHKLADEFPSMRFNQVQQWRLAEVIGKLKTWFPDVAFCECFESSSMRPDGGILSIEGDDGTKAYSYAGWYSTAPEPTSGLLLLVDMGLLGLKRKRV